MGAHPGESSRAVADVGEASASAIRSRPPGSPVGVKATTSNGFVPVRQLPPAPGLGIADLPEAIERGEIKAMIHRRHDRGPISRSIQRLSPRWRSWSSWWSPTSIDTPLAKLAHVVLPVAMSMEKDGTFTSFDRTVQRVRVAVPPMGEAKSHLDAIAMLAQRLGYGLTYRQPATGHGRDRAAGT